MRSLASIVKIDNVYELENSDNLSVAQIGGWKVVVKRGEYVPGDLAIYFEVDSFLPEIEEFEFMRKNSFKVYDNKPGFRLRTIKLRGQVSQGLLVNVSLLDKYPEAKDLEIVEGLDVTDILGVVKYDVEVAMNSGGPNRMSPSGNFPSFIIKTDETRIQDPKMLKIAMKYIAEKPHEMWYATSKLDGSSITIYKKDDHVGVCSRNFELKEEDGNQFWQEARRSGLVDFVTNFPKNIAIQGELVGPGIQKNRLKLTEKTVYVFNAFDIDTFTYYTGFELVALAKEHGLKLVPVLYTGMVPTSSEELLKFCEKLADAKSPVTESELQEGTVFRPMNNSDISFKFISPSYLLSHGI